MTDDDAESLFALLRRDIHAGTARIAWSELQRLFAAGKVVQVSPELDLVDVALQMSNDNAVAVRQWLDSGQLAPVSDDQARQWVDSDASVWAVVVKPWVLVQDCRENRHEH